ncbi:MAG: HD domain-containing protein [Acidobacteria bacterium]|nr:HD domain-containing protein [Acidobacteriota bacterium]
MKSAYVSGLQPNQIVSSIFLVQYKDIRQKRTGEPYLALVLGDRTGEIEAKMWDNVAEVMDTFARDDFLKVRGLAQVYQNRLQFTVHRLQKQSESEIDHSDFFPTSRRDPEEMFTELRGIISAISNPHLRCLLEALFDDAEIARRYKIAPAAKTVHHAYLGGLLEHVLSLCALARFTASHYPAVDLDLLLAGIILHDLGKIYELSYDRSFAYTSEGQLLGHMIIALRMIDEKRRALPDFPQRLRTLLEHMIISHHGELEFGSPKVPLFPEALLLHHLDNLDSKMECMRAFLQKDKSLDGCWTAYNPALERTVLKKSRYLDDAPEEPPAAPVPVPAEFMPAGAAASGAHAPPARNADAAVTGPPAVTAPIPEAAIRPGPALPPEDASAAAKSTFAEKLRSALRGDR